MKSTPVAKSLKKGRNSYHHGDLRGALVLATLGIVESAGTGAVSLSAAARLVGVSPQAVYNHFRDKEELLAAVAEQAVQALAVRLREARDNGRGAGPRLEATGVAYVMFAYENRAAFRLLSAPELAQKEKHPSLLAAFDAAFSILLGAVEEAQLAEVVRKSDTRKLAIAAWSTVHGVAWLLVDGQVSISGAPEDPAQVARDALRVLFKGLHR